MKSRQQTPGVGQYEVEKSRNQLDQQVPHWSMPTSKKVLFNEKIAKEKISLPDIYQYEASESYKNVSVPYMNKDISLPFFPKKFRMY